MLNEVGEGGKNGIINKRGVQSIGNLRVIKAGKEFSFYVDKLNQCGILPLFLLMKKN